MTRKLCLVFTSMAHQGLDRSWWRLGKEKRGKISFFVLQIAHVPPYFLFPFSVICVAYQSSKEGERRSISRGNPDCRAPDLRPSVHHQCSAKILGLYNFDSFRSRSYIPFRSRSQLALARSLYWSNKHTRPYLGVFCFCFPYPTTITIKNNKRTRTKSRHRVTTNNIE